MTTFKTICRGNREYAVLTMTDGKPNLTPRYSVLLRPYSLKTGEVGKPIFKPVLVSRHTTKQAAARALTRVITGTNRAAFHYLRNLSTPDCALHYVVQDIATGENYSRDEILEGV